MDTLQDRFLAPPGWQSHFFTNRDTNHKIHYGFATPQGKPSAVVVCLGGLSEFAEKYFEIAHDMLDRNYAFYFMDWYYQGRSGRLLKTPHRRHSDGFNKDVSDLDYFLKNTVRPAAGSVPVLMLAHSMGANIGLQYLSRHPGIFSAAAMSAPFLGIYNFTWPLRLFATAIQPLLPFIGETYVFHGKDWEEDFRDKNSGTLFSHDENRARLHNYWSKLEPDLRVGNVTFGWVIQALASCAQLTHPDTAPSISIPVLIALAGQDKIVDNHPARVFANRLPHGRLLELESAHHEILMEKDEYRTAFLANFDTLLSDHKIGQSEE